MLGAKTAQLIAAQAEAACVAGDAYRAGDRSTELVIHLNALRSSAASARQSGDLGTTPHGTAR